MQGECSGGYVYVCTRTAEAVVFGQVLRQTLAAPLKDAVLVTRHAVATVLGRAARAVMLHT